MGERRSGRFRLGRRPRTDGDTTPPDEPCVPCGQQADLRQFSLNPDAENPVDDDLVPVLRPEVLHAVTDGEVVLFDPLRSTSSLLNTSAALIWASIDGDTPIATIVDELVEETGADRATVDRDVRDTIMEFARGGLLLPTAVAASSSPPEPTSEADQSHTNDEEPDGRRRRLIEAVLSARSWCFVDRRWAAGAPVEVRTDSEELAELLAPALAPLAPTGAPDITISIVDRGRRSARRFRIMRDSAVFAVAPTPAAAIDSTFTLLNDLAINRSPGRLILHAGVVEREGAVIVVAGPSGRGKSTLTAALVQRGYGYLSDEVAAIDPDSLDVLAYPKPLDLSASSAELLGLDAVIPGPKAKVPVSRLGEVGAAGGRVRLLVLLDDPNDEGEVSRSAAHQLVAILTNTFASTFEPSAGPARPLEALASLTERVSILHLARTAPDAACLAIEDHLRSTDVATAT